MHSHSKWKERLRPFIPDVLLSVRRSWIAHRRRRLLEQFIRLHGCRVYTGPFAGLKYVKSGAGSAIGPKLLGSYESELWPVITSYREGDFDSVIHVGAGEGYYVAGFAVRFPSSHSMAFEIDPRGQELINELAQLNELSARVRIRGECTLAGLSEALSEASRPLLVMDVEGIEDDLLDPERISSLRKTKIIVEVHDYIRVGVAARLIARFAQSHTVHRIPTVDLPILPNVPGFSLHSVRLMADEMRPQRMEWFWMTPHEEQAERR